MTPDPAGRDAPRPGAGMLQRVRSAWQALERGHDALFVARWRGDLRRSAARQEEELLALLLLDALGAESPTAYYTLELYPWLAAQTHQLHRARGLDRWDSGACC